MAVDFTVADPRAGNLEWCADNGVHAVVGTTGFSDADLAHFEARFAATRRHAVIAPNFAVGAVLMMRFAESPRRYFETAEVIELHHDHKVDTPSGTAMRTARSSRGRTRAPISPGRDTELAEGARGAVVEGVRVHSVRLRGLVAHQEVLLGDQGQTLTIRHDSYDRTSFMPGVLLAVRAVRDKPGLPFGLDTLLGL